MYNLCHQNSVDVVGPQDQEEMFSVSTMSQGKDLVQDLDQVHVNKGWKKCCRAGIIHQYCDIGFDSVDQKSTVSALNVSLWIVQYVGNPFSGKITNDNSMLYVRALLECLMH